MSDEILDAQTSPAEEKKPVEEFKKPEDVNVANQCLVELNALLDKWKCNLAVGMVINAQGNQPLLNVVQRPPEKKLI